MSSTMGFCVTNFYGNDDNLKRLHDDLTYCMECGDFDIIPLLKKNGFDPDVYNKSYNTENINFKLWETMPPHSYNKDGSVGITFEVWDQDTDYRPLTLISKIYDVNYYAYGGLNRNTKSSNFGSKRRVGVDNYKKKNATDYSDQQCIHGVYYDTEK